MLHRAELFAGCAVSRPGRALPGPRGAAWAVLLFQQLATCAVMHKWEEK